WLKSFWSTTMQMSTTRASMLSTTHAIFQGLQEDIKEIFQHLPTSVPPSIKHGLIDAHTKLSDHYHRYDESPFYTWVVLLDPHISLEGMRLDYASDESLSAYLETSKADLYEYYETHSAATNELDKFFKLPQEDFETCNPIHWWMGHHAQFSNLF
ncbi:hypothetical protein BJV74DRAFT_762921, partial [Russula compacta]